MTAPTSPEQMLREFHASKVIHGGLMPSAPTADIPEWVQELRLALLDEEVRELHEAVEAGDIVKIADGIADIAYVVAGTAVAYGVPFDAVFAEVHRSNMTKINTPAEAKLVKGPHYKPPRIAEILGVLECEACDGTGDATPLDGEVECWCCRGSGLKVGDARTLPARKDPRPPAEH